MSHGHPEPPVQMNKEPCWPWKWIFSVGMDPGKLFLTHQTHQLPNLHQMGFGCPELPVCSEAAQVLQQCPGQAAGTRSAHFLWKTCVSLVPHFSATCGCWLMAGTPSAPIFRPYLWVTLCLLTASKANLEFDFISFATEVALGMSLTRDFSSVLQNWCMYRKITENRAGRELSKVLSKKSSLQTKATQRKHFLSSIWLPKLIFKTASGEDCTRNLLQCYFYHSNCFL